MKNRVKITVTIEAESAAPKSNVNKFFRDTSHGVERIIRNKYEYNPRKDFYGVTKKDILNHLNSSSGFIEAPSKTKKLTQPSESLLIDSSRVEEMPKMRKIISSHMKESLDTAAHVYLMTEVDMTKVVSYVLLIKITKCFLFCFY